MPISRLEDLERAIPEPYTSGSGSGSATQYSYTSGGNGGYINKPTWGGGGGGTLSSSYNNNNNTGDYNNSNISGSRSLADGARLDTQARYTHQQYQYGGGGGSANASYQPQFFQNGGRSPTSSTSRAPVGNNATVRRVEGRDDNYPPLSRTNNTNTTIYTDYNNDLSRATNNYGQTTKDNAIAPYYHGAAEVSPSVLQSGSLHLFEPEPLAILSPSSSSSYQKQSTQQRQNQLQQQQEQQQSRHLPIISSTPSSSSKNGGPADYGRAGVGAKSYNNNNNNNNNNGSTNVRQGVGVGDGGSSISTFNDPACLSSAAVESLASELQPIEDKLRSLEAHTARLEDLQLAYLADNEKRTQKRIENTINAINKDALEIKALMGKFDQNTQLMASRGLVQQNIIEMRNNQLSNCGKKLVERTKAAWTLQKDHEKRRTKQAAKRLKVRFAEDVSSDGRVGLTDEEAQAMAVRLVQSGNDDQLFLLARDELERAMATKEQVLAIEREMRELYQMFCDLNVLVVEQGESIREVESMVKSTTRNLEKGNKELKKAKKHQKACSIM